MYGLTDRPRDLSCASKSVLAEKHILIPGPGHASGSMLRLKPSEDLNVTIEHVNIGFIYV
jgi:hypothetical protein